MQIGKLKLALLIGGPLLLIILSVAGYFIYTSLMEQHRENTERVEGFGELVIPGDIKSELLNPDSTLTPSIPESRLSPSERVILTLKLERAKLVEEAVKMRAQISELQDKVVTLEEYKRTNERYSPHSFDEEVSQVHTRIKQLLATLDESKRFTRNQLKGMSAAAAKEYRRYLKQYKLVLEPGDIDTVVNEHLPVYAYCIGDGMDIAANNRAEELFIIEYFKTDKTELMSSRLRSDLKAIMEPCQEMFNKRMAYLL